MWRADHDKSPARPTEIIVIGDVVGEAVNLDSGSPSRQTRHYYPDGSIHHHEPVTMMIEKAPFMKKEPVSPVGDLHGAMGQLPDKVAVVATVALAAFSTMPITTAAMDLPFTMPAAMATTATGATTGTATGAATCHGGP